MKYLYIDYQNNNKIKYFCQEVKGIASFSSIKILNMYQGITIMFSKEETR